MKHHYGACGAFVTAVFLTTTALAQTATGTGTGVANSSSQSAAGAVAVNRGNGGNSSLVVNNPATSTSTVTQAVSGGTHNINENVGTSTIKNVPTAVAPSLAAAGIETCLGSVSGGGSFVGTGLSFGGTVPDPGCQARLDARTLWSMGLKSAAVARLCIREDIYRSMPDICEQYRPAGGGYGVGYAAVAPVADPGAGYAREGVVMVVEGKTGITKPCDNYDEPHHRCLKWSGAPTRVASAKPKAKPSVVASSPPPVAATAPVTP